MLFDHVVGVGVDEVNPGTGAPVAEEFRFDIRGLQRTFQQAVVLEVDLSYGQIVRRSDIFLDFRDILIGHDFLCNYQLTPKRFDSHYYIPFSLSRQGSNSSRNHYIATSLRLTNFAFHIMDSTCLLYTSDAADDL